MSGSLLYASPFLYRAVMRLLYGRHFRARYEAVAAEVPAGASVVDVCAADGYLYRAFLRARVGSYLALDLSVPFVERARRLGIDARRFDLWREPVPPADVVILQASLYQFIPHAARILETLLRAARLKLVVAEPVRNLSDSRWGGLARLARRWTDPGGGAYAGARFNPVSLEALFRSFPALVSLRPVPGGREWVGVFRGAARAEAGA